MLVGHDASLSYIVDQRMAFHAMATRSWVSDRLVNGGDQEQHGLHGVTNTLGIGAHLGL